MAKIREEVEQEALELPDAVNHYRPSRQAQSNTPLIHTEELNYLNSSWGDWVQTEAPVSHRKFIGKFILKAKSWVVDTLWHHALGNYFERERKFQMFLVRYLNQNARYIDDRDASNFNQLNAKMDDDIRGLNSRVDQLHMMAQGEQLAQRERVDSEIDSIKQTLKTLSDRIETINREQS